MTKIKTTTRKITRIMPMTKYVNKDQDRDNEKYKKTAKNNTR